MDGQQSKLNEGQQQSTEGPVDSPAVPTSQATQEPPPPTEARPPEGQPEKAPATPPAPLPPLVMVDSRFTTLWRMAMKPFREKFIKLYKKTPDQAVRVLPDELSVFFAVMVFEELWGIRELVRQNPNPAVHAAHDPIHIFLQVLHKLIGRALPPEPPKEELEKKEAPDGAAVAKEGEGGPVHQDPEGPPRGPVTDGSPGAEVRSSGGADPAPGV